jgi:hypothetical protein
MPAGKPVPWTEDQFLKAIAMRRQNKPLKAIGRETGISERLLARRFLDIDLGFKPSFRSGQEVAKREPVVPPRPKIERNREAELRRADRRDDVGCCPAKRETACNEHLLDLRDHFKDGHGEVAIPTEGCAARASSAGRAAYAGSYTGSPAAMCAEG